MFDNLSHLAGAGSASETDELERYLAADLERVDDAIEWWQDRQKKYPRLSRMALDFLTIPGTSPHPHRSESMLSILSSHFGRG